MSRDHWERSLPSEDSNPEPVTGECHQVVQVGFLLLFLPFARRPARGDGFDPLVVCQVPSTVRNIAVDDGVSMLGYDRQSGTEPVPHEG